MFISKPYRTVEASLVEKIPSSTTGRKSKQKLCGLQSRHSTGLEASVVKTTSTKPNIYSEGLNK